jgi:predicted GNAT family acetyltransferase
MTPPRHLIISRMPDPALVALTDYFLKESITVPGVVGPKSTTRLLAAHWKNQTGKSSRLKMIQRIYACECVVVQVYNRGHLRPAIESDEALLVQWSAEFCREAGIEDEIEHTKGRIPNEIARQSLYVWDNDQVVSMALVQRETACGICVSMVYTPPHLRKQGYATLASPPSPNACSILGKDSVVFTLICPIRPRTGFIRRSDTKPFVTQKIWFSIRIGFVRRCTIAVVYSSS